MIEYITKYCNTNLDGDFIIIEFKDYNEKIDTKCKNIIIYDEESVFIRSMINKSTRYCRVSNITNKIKIFIRDEKMKKILKND